MDSFLPAASRSSPNLELTGDKEPASSDGRVELVDRMKLYVEQVILICTAMLSTLQLSGADTATASAPRSEPKNEEQAEFLKQKLRELVSMNVSWQQTHQQQEQTIAELKERVRQLELQLQTSEINIGGLSDQQQAEIDRHLMELRNKYEQVASENCRAVEEYNRLKIDHEVVLERNGVLELQLLTNREDFDNERRDRERTQSKVDELERELERYRLRLQTPSAFQQLPSAVGQYCGAQMNPTNPWTMQYQQRPMMRGRYVTDGLDVSDCVEDGPSEVATTTPISTSPVGRGSSPHDEKMQCPKCRRSFTKDQHEQFMDHLDRCF